MILQVGQNLFHKSCVDENDRPNAVEVKNIGVEDACFECGATFVAADEEGDVVEGDEGTSG